MERTTRKTVIFRYPARLNSVEGELPAGSYEVETDEEMILNLSFLAYRRVKTCIVVPGRLGSFSSRQSIDIDPEDLAAALARDTLTAAELNP